MKFGFMIKKVIKLVTIKSVNKVYNENYPASVLEHLLV